MYKFPVAIVTDYRKFGGLKQQKLFSLMILEVLSWKSMPQGSNQGVSRAILPLEALGENPFLAFLHSGDCQYSLDGLLQSPISNMSLWSHCLLLSLQSPSTSLCKLVHLGSTQLICF